MTNNETLSQEYTRLDDLFGQMEKEKSKNILTNLSLNSKYKTFVSIFGQVHWFNQLRICEQIIVEKTSLLEKLKEQDQPNSDYFFPFQFRDAVNDLEIAIAAKAKILEEHPDLQDMSFDQIQEQYGKQAYMQEVSHRVSCQLLAGNTGIPYEILEFILRFPEADKEELVATINDNFAALGLTQQLSLPTTKRE